MANPGLWLLLASFWNTGWNNFYWLWLPLTWTGRPPLGSWLRLLEANLPGEKVTSPSIPTLSWMCEDLARLLGGHFLQTCPHSWRNLPMGILCWWGHLLCLYGRPTGIRVERNLGDAAQHFCSSAALGRLQNDIAEAISLSVREG
jgi:hypothetical protein